MLFRGVRYSTKNTGGDGLSQYTGNEAYKQFWEFSKEEKRTLSKKLAIELSALRGKVGAS